ncbi:MAG: hypothetical protein M1831_006268 [Alyxoria varia]|nr:MAG: hypothetical protein M1831_006268 [Alyxoria varia]
MSPGGHFEWETPGLSKDASRTPSCKDLPGAGDVFVILKTGAHEARDRVPTHLDTILRCVPRFAIFSDLEETIAGHTVQDVLAQIPKSVREKHAEFEAYDSLKRYQAEGRQGEYQDLMTIANKKEDAPGWKLDKWKFLPLLEKAIEHDARWYFFMETDTNLVWSNLLRWLNQLDPKEAWYLGGPSWFGDHIFAHGGTGFALSKPAVSAAIQTIREKPEHYHEVVSSDCCGDSILSTVMSDLNITLLQSWPMLQGETVSSLDYTERHWCWPIVSQHHMKPEEITAMWEYEQKWLTDTSATTAPPIMHRDVFDRFLGPIVRSGDIVDDWDNLSNDESIDSSSDGDQEYKNSSTNPQACQALCQQKSECIQFSYKTGLCKLGHVIRLGSKIGSAKNGGDKQGMVSGWMADRIKDFQSRMEPCKAQWILEHNK